MNLSAPASYQCGSRGAKQSVMIRRIAVAFVTFISLIVPSALLMAMLAAPARPQPIERAQDLGRLDNDVARTRTAIAANCSTASY
jgi:hypothetical protein